MTNENETEERLLHSIFTVIRIFTVLVKIEVTMKLDSIHLTALTRIEALLTPVEGMIFSWVSKDIPLQATLSLPTGPSIPLSFSLHHRVNRRILGDESTIVVCPFMSNELDEYCRSHRVNYIDLCGNSFLSWPGIHIHVRGNRNQFPTSGRAATSPFERSSIVSSRILRMLLSDHRRTWKMQELADACGCSVGQVAKIKAFLANQAWLDQTVKGIAISHPAQLLRSWASVYNKHPNTVLSYHTLLPLAEVEQFISTQERSALTSFAAGARLQNVVNYHVVHAYVAPSIVQMVESELQLRPVEAGANVMLLIPYDDSIFTNTFSIDGQRLVSPVQIFLDLMAQRGRGEEMAEAILKREIVHEDSTKHAPRLPKDS